MRLAANLGIKTRPQLGQDGFAPAGDAATARKWLCRADRGVPGGAAGQGRAAATGTALSPDDPGFVAGRGRPGADPRPACPHSRRAAIRAASCRPSPTRTTAAAGARRGGRCLDRQLGAGARRAAAFGAKRHVRGRHLASAAQSGGRRCAHAMTPQASVAGSRRRATWRDRLLGRNLRAVRRAQDRVPRERDFAAGDRRAADALFQALPSARLGRRWVLSAVIMVRSRVTGSRSSFSNRSLIAVRRRPVRRPRGWWSEPHPRCLPRHAARADRGDAAARCSMSSCATARPDAQFIPRTVRRAPRNAWWAPPAPFTQPDATPDFRLT